MNKSICMILLIICLIITMCGCIQSEKQPQQPTDGTEPSNTQLPTDLTEEEFKKTIVAVSVPTTTETTKAADGTILFQYTYQHISLILHRPAAADKVILDFLNRVDHTRESAEATRDMAKAAYNGDTNWVPYQHHITYSPMRIDHNVLSLFGNNVVYSGAFHPDRTCVSVNYDLRTGDVLTLASIMTTQASSNMFCNLVLDELSKLTEGDYLYENYADIVKHRFTIDASQDEAWYFTPTGLNFYFAPYEIGPYSSGVVTVEIPYEKLKTLLNKNYLPENRSETTGSITLLPFEEVNLEQFTQIAELIESNSGKMYMAQIQDTVQDIRISIADIAGSYNVFAAYNLNTGGGIMIQADTEVLKNMTLTYKSGNQTVTAPLLK